MKAAVNTARALADHLGQAIDVRTFKLGELAILLHEFRHRMIRARGELAQHLRIGAARGLRALDDRQLELVEQHFGELLGRIDVEWMADGSIDTLRKLPVIKRTQ